LGSGLRPQPGHFPERAKAVIQLVQNGGPSQVDLFDPKPELQKRDGQQHRFKVEMFQPGSEANILLASPFEFRRHPATGMEFSEVLTHTPSIAEDICLVRSMHSEHNNHTEALILLATGKIFRGRPSLGAWISYALGTENRNLPAYIVLRDPEGYNTNATLNWDNGWLPALYAGTEFSTQGSPVLNLRPAVPMPEGVQEDKLAFLVRLNEEHRARYPFDSDLEARIRNYELAARMQISAGDLVDLSKESAATKKLYGLDHPETASYGARCLMARRLVEAGVRFVQVFPPVKPSFQPWDSHTNVKSELEGICGKTEQPAAALIQDLKSRGLLEQTLVVWTGEFGRLPVSQNGRGRDHNRNAFTLWLAGGGMKAGHVHGSTDEVGYKAVEKPVSVADLHATILHQLGLDHRKLTYVHNGREESLTDPSISGARVAGELLQAPPVAA
ncbi:MAG: DUF1501 domain-containing protein, partial [Acidobacteria bacterium]|nr:DUF1501 domain-containing protein [Acidobacteriota bacterium]